MNRSSADPFCASKHHGTDPHAVARRYRGDREGDVQRNGSIHASPHPPADRDSVAALLVQGTPSARASVSRSIPSLNSDLGIEVITLRKRLQNCRTKEIRGSKLSSAQHDAADVDG